MDTAKITIPKSWRSEISLFFGFVILCALSVRLSALLPGSIIVGNLFRWRDNDIILSLPLFAFMPATALGMALFRIYNVRYVVDDKGVGTRIGVLWTSQHFVKVRYEDILSIEIRQDLLDRFLDVGNVEISSAATDGIEINLEGVGSPHKIREILQSERDRREEELKSPEINSSQVVPTKKRERSNG